MSEAKRRLREFENHIAFITSVSDFPELVHTVVIHMTQYQLFIEQGQDPIFEIKKQTHEGPL